VIHGVKDHVQPNLTKDEKMPITSLLNDHSIVIRPADNGSGVVVEDAESYIEKLEQENVTHTSYRVVMVNRKQNELLRR